MTRSVHPKYAASVARDADGNPISASRKAHASLASTAEEVAALDDQAVLLNYRRLSSRIHMAGRGTEAEVAKRELFLAEVTKRKLI